MIRILIVDDHEIVRRGLELVLSTEPDLAVVGAAGSGAEAIAQACELQPDVVVLDLKMPGMSGVLACHGIKQVAPQARVLILTGINADDAIMTTIEHDIDGYLLKDAPSSELIQAIRIIARGQAYIQPAVARRILRRLATTAATAGTVLPPPLTPRELDVLRLMATSRTTREIADTLTISEETARSHVKSILAKLKQPNRTQAVLAALRLQLIELN